MYGRNSSSAPASSRRLFPLSGIPLSSSTSLMLPLLPTLPIPPISSLLPLPDMKAFAPSSNIKMPNPYQTELSSVELQALCPPDFKAEACVYYTNMEYRSYGVDNRAEVNVRTLAKRAELLIHDFEAPEDCEFNVPHRLLRYLYCSNGDIMVGLEGSGPLRPKHRQLLVGQENAAAFVAGDHGYNANNEIVYISNRSSDWPYPPAHLAYAFRGLLRAGAPFAERVYVELVSDDAPTQKFFVSRAVILALYSTIAAINAPIASSTPVLAEIKAPQLVEPTTPTKTNKRKDDSGNVTPALTAPKDKASPRTPQRTIWNRPNDPKKRWKPTEEATPQPLQAATKPQIS